LQVGSQSIIFAKSIAELIKMTAKGNNQFVYWQTYLMLVGMVVTIFTQIHWLAQGLKHFDAVYCIPIFQGKVIQSERAAREWSTVVIVIVIFIS
jgi:hypothetical protein